MHYQSFKSFSFLLFLIFGQQVFGQKIEIKHVEPMHWWLGMKNKNLQVLVHGDKISSCTVSIKEPGLGLKKVNKTDNANYLFLDLEIGSSAKPGVYHISLSNGSRNTIINYELKSRSQMAKGAAGYGPEDVLYLIMPDRFSNGKPENDFVDGYNERPVRTEPFGRHGGDLVGIENHLDYVKNLGVTTLWLNPILENNQPHQSYHGYAFTDLYKVDARLGSLEDYKRLTAKCHNMGLKMVQDMVANHIGSKHWWMDDRPSKDWIHSEGDPFNRSNFRIETVADPHGAKFDRDKMLDGWFDIHMPDMNQKNPFLANYLIQNSIWWIAEIGIDGIRMDTYPYNDKDYMTRWCDEILREFPDFSLVGEVWVDQPSYEAYFTKGAKNQDGYKAGLPSVTDFPTYYAINKALTEKGNWDNGLQRIYSTLCQDFLYKDPSEHLLFLDNHDLTRFYTYQKEDFSRFKQGLGMLLTLRGVPQLYYGTELLMTGDGSFHPDVRKDFQGGWVGDVNNLFEEKNRTGKMDSAFRFCQSLLNWRKTSPAIKSGKFVHYLPENNVYTYFRTHKDQTIMVVVNGNEEEKEVNLKPFLSQISAFSMASEVVTGKNHELKSEKWTLPGKGIWIMELKR